MARASALGAFKLPGEYLAIGAPIREGLIRDPSALGRRGACRPGQGRRVAYGSELLGQQPRGCGDLRAAPSVRCATLMNELVQWVRSVWRGLRLQAPGHDRRRLRSRPPGLLRGDCSRFASTAWI